MRIAIVGGGPGGLLTGFFLKNRFKSSCEITLFESSARLGGKIQTLQFESARLKYEAGVAELYDYSECGSDPLRDLVAKLGLPVIPMSGQTVVLDGRILRNRREVRAHSYGALKAIEEFRRRAVAAMPLSQWYEGIWHYDNVHPWAKTTCQEILEGVPDPVARKYLRVSVHSDLATEPHLTNGLNGLKNFLMDVPGYIRLYSIVGGIERFVLRLTEQLKGVQIHTCRRVVSVSKGDRGYRLCSGDHPGRVTEEFDAVFIALPHNALGNIEWESEALARAMSRFIAYYDRPAHYLRVSALFRERFWQSTMSGSWFVLDGFGGCCIYDESARYKAGRFGVLGWLLAGSNALSLSNCSDNELAEIVIGSLPTRIQKRAREAFLEAKVHRWLASVNAQPGGVPVRDTRSAHLPEPEDHPRLFMVGDYLFDCTVNGVLDSAQAATDLLYADVLRERTVRTASNNGRPGSRTAKPPESRRGLDHMYFDQYHDGLPYSHTYREYFDAKYVVELIRIVWARTPPYRILDAGSANALSVKDFLAQKIDAWGVERSRYIHGQTPDELKKRNHLGDVCNLEFPDNHFDFVYETCLAYLPRAHLKRAVHELHRVAKRGVILGSITTDMNTAVFSRRHLLYGMRTFMPLWEWAELFLANGFELASTEPRTLQALWRCEKKFNAGDEDWYPDRESLRFCFYSKAQLDGSS